MSQNGRCERKDKIRNLERVLQAAHDLLAENGPHVTMEEVARRAGVGVGTIYRRFPSKEHLIAAVSGAACRDLHADLHAIAYASDHPLVRLRTLIVAVYRHSHGQAPLLACSFAHTEGLESAPSDDAFDVMLRLLFAAIIREGQAQGAIVHRNPELLAAFCTELANPSAAQRLATQLALEPADLAEEVADMILGALRSPLLCSRDDCAAHTEV